jgi:hypothetical protein
MAVCEDQDEREEEHCTCQDDHDWGGSVCVWSAEPG